MELEGADLFRIGAYRKAAARIRETPSSVAQLALDGKAKAAAGDRQDDRGEDRRGRRGRRDPCADEAEGGGARGGRDVHAPAGARPEDGTADLAGARHHDGRRAAGGGRGAGAAGARRDRRRAPRQKIAAALAQPQATRRAASRAARHHAAEAARGRRRCCASTRRRSRSRSPARRAACARRCATSTSSRRRPTRRRSSTTSARSAGSSTSRPRARPRRRSSRTTGSRFDLRVVPPESYGNLLQHFTGSKNHNVALREDAVRRGFSVSEYSVTDVETGEEHRFAHEAGGLPRSSATTGSRRSCARTAASSPPRATASCRRSSSSATCAATCTRTRRGPTARTRSRTWSPRRSSARLRVLRDLRPLAAAARRPAAPAVGADRRAERARGAVPHPQGDRGRTSAPTARSTSRTRSSRRATGSSRPSHSRFDHDPTERVLAAMESPYVDCIGHLDEPQDRQAAARAGRRRAGDRAGARDGDVPRDQLAARPARPDRRPRARRARGRA